MVLYPQKNDGTFPTGGVGYPSTATTMVVGMRDGDFCGEMLSGQDYWLVIENTAAQSTTNRIWLMAEINGNYKPCIFRRWYNLEPWWRQCT